MPTFIQYNNNAKNLSTSSDLIKFAIAGLVILSPLLALIFYPEEINLAWGFVLPGVILTIVGGLLWRFLARLEFFTVFTGTIRLFQDLPSILFK